MAPVARPRADRYGYTVIKNRCTGTGTNRNFGFGVVRCVSRQAEHREDQEGKFLHRVTYSISDASYLESIRSYFLFSRASRVNRLANNGDVAGGQLAVFQGASEHCTRNDTKLRIVGTDTVFVPEGFPIVSRQFIAGSIQ
jgi:hypothetical protein